MVSESAPKVHQKCTKSAPKLHHRFITFSPNLYIKHNLKYKTTPQYHQNCTTTSPQVHSIVLWHCLIDFHNLPLNFHGVLIHTAITSTFKRSPRLLESFCTRTTAIPQTSKMFTIYTCLAFIHIYIPSCFSFNLPVAAPSPSYLSPSHACCYWS